MIDNTENAPITPPDYVKRVNWAIDFILDHLQEPIKLDDIAKAACFSPFHFHKVFRSVIGETLSNFVTRVRLERALRILSHEPRRPLTDIARVCGLGSSANFSRVFRQRYGVPPSQFSLTELSTQRRDELIRSCPDEETALLLKRLPPGENPDGFEVTIRQLPARKVAYIRVLNPFQIGAVTGAAERLVSWAETRNLADGQWLGYMWDDPEIVDHKDCRYDVGIEAADFEPEGEIGQYNFPAMLVADLEIKGSIGLETRAFDWLYSTWLPTSCYLPSFQPCFESWLGRPFAHGYEYFELHVQLPIERNS